MIIYKVYSEEDCGGGVVQTGDEKYFAKEGNAEKYKNNLLKMYEDDSYTSVFIDEIETED